MINSDRNVQEEIKTATLNLVDKRIWAEQLLYQVRAIRNTRGKERQKVLLALELTIRKELGESTGQNPLYNLILDNSVKLHSKLSAIHGPLSDNDLFLSACISMGISIGEIAAIRGVDPSSVIMSRYRLKKKLGLSSCDDLDSYILEGLK